jgi:hypothetical protein
LNQIVDYVGGKLSALKRFLGSSAVSAVESDLEAAICRAVAKAMIAAEAIPLPPELLPFESEIDAGLSYLAAVLSASVTASGAAGAGIGAAK